MTSPARASFLRKTAASHAAKAAADSADALAAEATPYELLRAAMGQCLSDLSHIQSIEAKIERKREMLPDFLPWIDGKLAAAAEAEAAGVPFSADNDDIILRGLIWTLDVGAYEKALEIASYVLRYKLTLPERFKRTAATIVAEEAADAALKAGGQGEPFELEVLQRVAELTANEDMPDEVRAKLNKATGLELARRADALPDEGADGAAGGKRAAALAALASLKRALELNPRVGVKKEIDRLERTVRRLETPQG